MIYQFEHNYLEPRYWINKKEDCVVLDAKKLNKMRNINKDHKTASKLDMFNMF